MVREKLKRHDVIIWTGIKPINNPCANTTLKVLKMPSDISMPWVVIVSDLHLIHFQHHTGTWLSPALGKGCHPKWAREEIQLVQSERRVLSRDCAQIFTYFLVKSKHWCCMHLLIYSTHIYQYLLCVSPALWLRMRALKLVNWISSPAPPLLVVCF